MVEEVKVEFYPDKKMAEEYQVTGFHYAFLSSPKDGNKMCHAWIKCRDFLQDAVRNHYTGRNDSIYSFTYNPKKDPKLDLTKTRMLVKRVPHPNTDALRKEFDEMMKCSLRLINHYEKAADIKLMSKLMKVNDDKMYSCLFVGSGEWTRSSVLISLYTFLIRLGHKKIKFKDEEELVTAYKELLNPKNKQTNDTRYLATTYKHFHKVLEHRKELMFKQESEILFGNNPMDRFHHNSGIVRLCQFGTSEKSVNDKFREILK